MTVGILRPRRGRRMPRGGGAQVTKPLATAAPNVKREVRTEKGKQKLSATACWM